MKVAIVYPPLKSDKGVALLTQNRQFQWFSRPTYIFPVVPATAATMLKNAGHEVLFLDAIAAEMSVDEFERKLIAFEPDLVVMETKTPVVKRHWKWVARMKEMLPYFPRIVLVGDHVTAMPEESMENSPFWKIFTKLPVLPVYLLPFPSAWVWTVPTLKKATILPPCPSRWPSAVVATRRW